jgi:hypothetical protein
MGRTFEIPEGMELAAKDHDPLAVDEKRLSIPSNLEVIGFQLVPVEEMGHLRYPAALCL